MTVDFLISAPDVYTGNPREDFDYQNLRADLRSSVSDLRNHNASCVNLTPHFVVLRVDDPDADAMRSLRHLSATISLAMSEIAKPTHEAPHYRFAVISEYSVN